MKQILYTFTEDCNLRCRHCCGSYRPKGKTVSREDRIKVLNNLPWHTGVFIISGGEPFVRRNELFDMLHYIRHNITVLPLADIGVQTNGFWMRDENTVCNTLEELAWLGVSILEVTSMDKYHREQGVDTSRLEMKPGTMFYAAVKAFAEKHKAELRIKEDSYGDVETRLVKPGMLEREVMIIKHVAAEGDIVPFGRAKDLPQEEVKERTSCGYNPKTQEEMGIAIAADGQVYPCCWKVSAPMGSAIETPVGQIIRNARKDRVLGALMAGGPKEAAKAMGIYNPKDEFMYRRNPCVICEEIFRGMR